jgi:Predicted nucleotidyltransferases
MNTGANLRLRWINRTAYNGGMIRRSHIKRYAVELARAIRPERIILFGSYAYGKPTSDSDVDQLVVMPHTGHDIKEAVRIRQCLAAPFPLDLIVRTPEALRDRLDAGDAFLKSVMERGKVLYEASQS